jgi:predicted MFS family arabinose efflux permease
MDDAARATRRLLLVLGIGAASSTLASRLLDPLVGEIAAEFEADAGRVALLATAFSLPYALVQPVLGPLGDALGKRRVIRACCILLAITLAAAALAPDLSSLMVLRMLAGAAAGGIFPLAIAMVGDQVPLARRQLALSRLLVAGLTGSAVGGALAALLAPFTGWRGVLLVAAGVALAGWWVLRGRDPGEGVPLGRRIDVVDVLRRYRQILGMARARALYGAVFVEGMLVFGMFPFLAPTLSERGLGGVAEAGMAVALFALGGFLFAAVAAPLLRLLSQRRVMQAGGALAALGLLGVGFAPLAPLLIGACLPIGFGFYMLHTSIQTGVTEVAPAARGSAVALHAFSFFLGQALGPVLVALGRAALGMEATLVLAAMGLLLLGLVLGGARQARE